MAKGKGKSLLKQCDNLWSNMIKQRAEGKCEICGSDNYLSAHHIVPRTNYALRHDLENGVALCRRHHLYWAHKDVLDFSAWFTVTFGMKRLAYLETARHRQSKNDYMAIKLYLEGL